MSRHRARSPRRTGLVVTGLLALVAAALLGLGGAGTLAFWTDTASVAPGTIEAGTLDLEVDGAEGRPTAYVESDLTLTGMVPGESVASTLTVTNAGDAPFTFTQTTSKAPDALSQALVVEVFAASTASGNDTSYPRTESCVGGDLMTGGTTARRLDLGTALDVCVRVSLPTTAPDAVQGLTAGALTIRLDATQVLP